MIADRPRIRARAAALEARFVQAGATLVETEILQPADQLLDLYGEDIRARAYVTRDPVRGECMMRPDFTVPVVRAHMQSGADAARYTYTGTVFRKQERARENRPSEFLQVGYELFNGLPPAEADAEVFALFSDVLAPLGLRAATGDIGILLAAVEGLSASPQRRAALRRHLWRPQRFRALLDRFSGRRPMPPSRADLLARASAGGAAAALLPDAPVIGLRAPGEVRARIDALIDDARQPVLVPAELDVIDHIVNLRETYPNALETLRDMAVDLPAIAPAIARAEARAEALAARGVDVDSLDFEAAYGRTTLEYYDGFVFGFYAGDRPDLPPVATGGRYDALTAVLGEGRALAAVGGVIRPELVELLDAGTATGTGPC